MAPKTQSRSRRESLGSPDAIHAALLRAMEEDERSGLPVPFEWQKMVPLLDIKLKLELLTMSLAFEATLKAASSAQLRELVDAGMLKILCKNLESIAGDGGFVLCANKLTTFLNSLPEPATEAWSYGAVRPITSVIMRKRDLKNHDLLRDEALKAALSFLVSMGKPWQDHLLKPGSQKEAKKATGKLFRWMVKEGIVNAVADIWCVMPHLSLREKAMGSNYEQLCYYCVGVLWYATLVQIHMPDLAAKTELLKPVFHYLLEEHHLFSDVRAMSLSLLLHLWLVRTSEHEIPHSAETRKAIAVDKDAWRVVDLLKPLVDDPGREPQLAKPHTHRMQVVQMSYLGLVSLLTNPPERAARAPAPLAPYLETLCHLLGEIPDAANWSGTREVVSALFRNGTLSDDVLLTHAYPGFLRALVAHVARCGYATSSPPGQVATDPQSEKLLFPMLAFLAAAFSGVIADVSKEQGTPPDPELMTAGPTLTDKSLMRLSELITSTRAAGALGALSRSPFYPRSNLICSAAVQAVPKDERAFRAILDQMVPAVALSMYEDSDATHARAIERGILIRHIARVLRDDKPLKFGILSCDHSQTFGKRHAMYLYDSNLVAVSCDVEKGREHVVAEVLKAIDESSKESRATSVAEDFKKIRRHSTKAKCGVCGLEVSALKRCSRCREVGYCGAECQAEDWPSHKKVCKQRA